MLYHYEEGSIMTQKITTFLMFDGQAEEAMNFYTSLWILHGER